MVSLVDKELNMEVVMTREYLEKRIAAWLVSVCAARSPHLAVCLDIKTRTILLESLTDDLFNNARPVR